MCKVACFERTTLVYGMGNVTLAILKKCSMPAGDKLSDGGEERWGSAQIKKKSKAAFMST